MLHPISVQSGRTSIPPQSKVLQVTFTREPQDLVLIRYKSGFESGVNQLIAGGYGGFQGNPGGYAGYFPPSSSFNYHYGNEAGDYVTSLTGTSASTRRKREVGEMSDVFSSYRKKFEKYYSIYRSAVEDENCMNRIICELGSTMSDIKGKTIMINIVDKFVPNWMESKMGVFKMAALSRDGSQCPKYRVNRNEQQQHLEHPFEVEISAILTLF
ncbi:uncharacterized protein LOC143233778 [Tachypleus tridentatus]|uniref:uncharacterized protein LOC143233778 n=1 Tax=Tachypleus tridentatus TaxID=6853 RepID=UPI003FCFA56A